mmetsp:Transcript_44351/g.101673  ORF Transcript_44351/g.101673 Transcript_44351/m.101673 type:complete len:221 (+) Transcript_44351:98-760(+)
MTKSVSSCTTRPCRMSCLRRSPPLLQSLRRRSAPSRRLGPARSSRSRRSTRLVAITSLPPRTLPLSCTPTATATSYSSPPRLPSTSSARPALRRCPTSWEAKWSTMATMRMLASPSTGARAGPTASMTTTRWKSRTASVLRWATITSRARPRAARPRSSTPSATGAAMTARCAFSCTTPRCLSSRNLKRERERLTEIYTIDTMHMNLTHLYDYMTLWAVA